MGEELVPEPVLRDKDICAERPVYSGRRRVGGNGRMKIFVHVSSPRSVLKISFKCLYIRMATCRLGNLWSDSFYTGRTSSRRNLDIIVKRYFYLSKKNTFTSYDSKQLIYLLYFVISVAAGACTVLISFLNKSEVHWESTD